MARTVEVILLLPQEVDHLQDCLAGRTPKGQRLPEYGASAPNRPASTTIRPQGPNRQLQSLTGPGSGAGLPQRQRYTPGHHTPSEKRGEKHRFGHCARACKGIVAHNPAQTQAHMHKPKTRRLVYCPPALTQTVSGRRGVHTCMRMHVLHTNMVVFPHLFYVFI